MIACGNVRGSLLNMTVDLHTLLARALNCLPFALLLKSHTR